MLFRKSRYILVILFMQTAICWGAVVYAQSAGPVATPTIDLANAMSLNTFDTAALDVNLKGPDGQPVKAAAVVTLIKLSNEAYRKETAKAGHIRFNNVAATEYSVQVVAPGYQTVVKHIEARKDEVRAVTIELQQMSVEDAAENSAYKALAPKAQKEIGKALELLRSQKVADARSHLDAANRAAPNQAEVQYLYGVYAKQTGNAEQAKAYWMKAVEFSPKHLLGLLSLADALLRENHESEALLYATRAVEVEPSSWRMSTCAWAWPMMQSSRRSAQSIWGTSKPQWCSQ
jgi:tetratricopeptide (TPR) repeat protein